MRRDGRIHCVQRIFKGNVAVAIRLGLFKQKEKSISLLFSGFQKPQGGIDNLINTAVGTALDAGAAEVFTVIRQDNRRGYNHILF